MVPFYGWGSTASRLPSLYKEIVYFLPQVPRSYWYTFNWSLRDERLGRFLSHPEVLTTRPLLHAIVFCSATCYQSTLFKIGWSCCFKNYSPESKKSKWVFIFVNVRFNKMSQILIFKNIFELVPLLEILFAKL